MSSRLPCDPPHPRTTKKASASAAAVQLLLRHRGGRAAAKDESIEFFSALSGQTGAADRRGKATRTGELRADAGKHDYDWLLTPPATPPCLSPALSRLTRATSASHAKSNSPLSRTRSSVSSTTSSGRPPPVRTLSSASSSSIKAPSSASGRSTPTTSPRLRSTPAAATACRPRPQEKTLGRRASSGSGAASQPKASSSSSSSTARPRAPTTGASSPKSTRTRVAPEQPASDRRGANAVARSRFAGQLGYDAMSTAPQAAENAVPPSTVKIKARHVPAAVKQSHGNGTATAMSTATQRRRSSPFPSPSPSPVTAASRSASLAGKGLSRSGGGNDGRKINDEKAAAPRRTAAFASSAVSLMRRGLARTDSRKLTESAGAHSQQGGASAQQRSTRSVTSGSLPGFAATVSDSDARGRRRPAAEKGKAAVAAATPVAAPDAFPSTRYDAMLLREDPKNLTWLNGCGEDDDDEDGACGAALVDGSLEPFHVTAAGTSGTTARF